MRHRHETPKDRTGLVVRAFWKHGNRAANTDAELARYFEKMDEAGVADHAIARTMLDAAADHMAHGLAIVDHRIPDDLGIPGFLRRRKVDAGAEYALAWAGIEGDTD